MIRLHCRRSLPITLKLLPVPIQRGAVVDASRHDGTTAAFTFFETRSIKFVNVVYSEFMHVDGRLALNQLLGPRRVTWPRKRRRRRQRRQPRRKRSNRSTKAPQRCTRGPCTLRKRQAAAFVDRTANSQTGPLCRSLLHDGPVFCRDLTRRSPVSGTPKAGVENSDA
jgi:hypothetical protein